MENELWVSWDDCLNNSPGLIHCWPQGKQECTSDLFVI